MAVESFSTERGHIHSELISYENRAGRRITAYLDAATRDLAGVPFVLMAPKYGETKKNNLQLAYYLVANGFAVLRFDFTNHIGESDGEMTDFTLSGAVHDIVASLDFLERQFGADDVIIVSSSLSSRCALRAAAEDSRVARLVCLVGVVSLEADIIGTLRAGRQWGVTDILGFNINGEIFGPDVLASNLHDLEGTIRDAEAIEVPVTYFYAERDLWVNLEDVRRAFGPCRNCRLIPVQGAMHEVRENPRAAEQVFRQTVLACLGRLDADDGTVPEVILPDRRLMLAQNRCERERLRAALPETEGESVFWSRYLKRYAMLERADDFREYLDLLGGLLGDFLPGCRVLDAGCGNGLFGLWLWLRLMQQRDPHAPLPAAYVGIDLTAAGLSDALRRHVASSWDQSPGDDPGPGARALEYSYLRMDFETLRPDDRLGTLPFADGTFDKVCCSLVLSYLTRPHLLLAEIFRVLRPGGILVVSSLKPYCDLSALYRGFIQQQVSPEELERARGLLQAAGRIKLKEEKGNYTFHLSQELVELGCNAGFAEARAYSSLGNQANVVRLVRP